MGVNELVEVSFPVDMVIGNVLRVGRGGVGGGGLGWGRGGGHCGAFGVDLLLGGVVPEGRGVLVQSPGPLLGHVKLETTGEE